VKGPDPRLLRSARAARLHLAVNVALGLIAAGLAIGQAWLLAEAITHALAGAGLAALGGSLVLLATILAGRAVVAWATEAAAQRTSAAVKSKLRMALLDRAMHLGPHGSVGARSGEVVTVATRGLDALDGYFAKYLPQLVLAAVVPAVVVLTLLRADPLAGLTVAITLPLIVVFMALIGLASEAQRRRRWRALTRLAHHFLDVVAGLPTLKVFGRARAQVGTLERVSDDYRRESLRALRVAFLSAFVLELFATLSVALVAVEIGLRLVVGDLDLRTGLFVLVLAPEAYLPLRTLGSQYHASEEGLAAAEAAYAIIEAPLRPAGPRSDVPDLRTGELRLEEVSVLWPDRGLLAPAAATLVVRPGEIVALAGLPGAGKTTVLEAICGLVTPDAGRIEVLDGRRWVPLSELDPEAWRRQLAWVPQEPFLVAGQVADNVRLAAPDASDAVVRRALARVGLGDLDPATVLGERGAGLSSGERRRVAVARAIARDAPLLLLDEPTAGLDVVSERLVLEAVRDLARIDGRAVLMVAHRPAALALADRVVQLTARASAAA
jgi:thiol reductant ABC exporter CydD subunit